MALALGSPFGVQAAAGGSLPSVVEHGLAVGSGVPVAVGVATDTDLGKLPVYFIPNEGQADSRVSFYVRGRDKAIYFGPDGVTFSLDQRKGSGAEAPRTRWNVKLDFVGAQTAARPRGVEKSDAGFSYFVGPRAKWHVGLPGYTRIAYENLWPGIDLAYGGTVSRIKYEFVVHPGADPSKIRLVYRGAGSVKLNEHGQIEVVTPAGEFTDDAPVAWQASGAGRSTVETKYILNGME